MLSLVKYEAIFFHASLLLQSGVKARGGDDGEIKKLIEKQLGYAKELGIFQEELLVSCAKEYASNTEKETAVDQECKTDLGISCSLPDTRETSIRKCRNSLWHTKSQRCRQ